MSSKKYAGALLVLLLGSLMTGSVAAQTSATIAGNVKDASGAVLPGVTVEAASPALIEKAVSVVTDDRGEYKIANLRPGVYTVTASLAGFSTFKREGIELSVGFTATINAELKVGSLQETVTVSGASPVVDTQNSRTQQVLKSDTMNALPSGSKNNMQFAALTLGAMASSQGSQNDVGGDKGEQATGIMLHGGRGDDSKGNLDGMNTNVFFGNGGGQQRVYYFNTVAVQEVVVDTGGNTAETETAGMNINLVPKEGGNTFRGYGTANYTSNRFSATSIQDYLVARGLKPQSTLKSIDDYGIGVGGPIAKDKLWFYGTSRWWGSQNYAASNFFNKSTNPFVYVADPSKPAYADTFFQDTSGRLTWQVAAKHKITQEEHLQHGCSCWLGIGRGALSAPEATTDFMYGPQVLSQTNWTYTATNKLLIQAGASFLKQNVSYVNGAPTDADGSTNVLGANKFTATGTPIFPGSNTHSIFEASTGYTYGAIPGGLQNYGLYDDSNNYNQRVVVSYITGSHAFKTGLQLLEGHYDYNGMINGVSQVTYNFNKGLPTSLVEWAGPFYSQMRLTQQGLFVQDQWTLSKLTMNLGVRFDHFAGRLPAFTTPAGPFIGARSLPAVSDLPNFKDITPRLGASYDVFGNGKTAIKVAFGRYLFGQGGALSQLVAPAIAIATNTTRSWDDNHYPAGDPRNGNFVPDCVLTDPTTNGECGTIQNATFGQPITNITIADKARQGWGNREYNYQTSVQLQQELRPGFGIAVGYFHTQWGNLLVQQNTSTAASDYTQYSVLAPTDPRLGSMSGQLVGGYYDVNPNKVGQTQRLITLASSLGLGTPEESYNGVEVGFNAKWGKGALVQGGVSVGRETTDYCYANGHPELTPENFPGVSAQFVTSTNYPRAPGFCHVVSSWWNGIGSQVKLQAVYPLPWDFQVSGTYKNIPGIPISATVPVANATVKASLGRDLAACPAVGACTLVALDQVLPIALNTGTNTAALLYDERLNETDLRLTRNFRFGRARFQPALDLYNVFNSRVPQTNNTTWNAGVSYLRPTAVLGSRLLKFGVQVDF